MTRYSVLLAFWQSTQALTRDRTGFGIAWWCLSEKSVKLADKPDFVREGVLQRPRVTAINLGRESPTRLGATYPPTQRTASTLAYLVLLRVEIARFTRRIRLP